MIQHRIATAIKKIETINDSINYYEIAKKEESDRDWETKEERENSTIYYSLK